MFDVAVIGAGIAGLVCTQQLVQAGYRVVIVEKSRGLGGRMATRRLHGTCADHGLCYLKPKEPVLQQLVQVLCDRHLLQVWTDTVYVQSSQQLESVSPFPHYVAPAGMSAIAKFLAQGLDIRLNQRVKAITPNPGNSLWHLTSVTHTDPAIAQPAELTAKAVVVAIPAPQALMLLSPLAETGIPSTFLDNLRSVEFDPCLSVIAGYSIQGHQNPDWKAVTFRDRSDLSWIGLDSSKRIEAGPPVFVLHSSAEFAKRFLEVEDLHPSGRQLLIRAAGLLPWLDNPEWMQVHRWRYAFPSRPWPEAYLSVEEPLPLVCCGDWCGGYQVESAIKSGLAAATRINHQLQQRVLPEGNLFEFL